LETQHHVEEARADRLAAAIYDYLLWEPGKAGHADAHKRLQAALKTDQFWHQKPRRIPTGDGGAR
jgi:hypothetical protein